LSSISSNNKINQSVSLESTKVNEHADQGYQQMTHPLNQTTLQQQNIDHQPLNQTIGNEVNQTTLQQQNIDQQSELRKIR